MLTYRDIVKLKTLFQNNENVIQYIKSNTQLNTQEAILHSYDLQAGAYIRELADEEVAQHKRDVGNKLARILKELDVSCVCEAGVGEATTLGHLLPNIELKNKFGFDISMSRLLYAQKYLDSKKQNANLFCAELATIPFMNDSIECVYTFHSLEPNGGNERPLLQELLRVTKKYLILIEPDYDLFSLEQKKRMDQHGYVKHLHQHLLDMGADVIHYEPWGYDSYELNKLSIIIVKKPEPLDTSNESIQFISHRPLVDYSTGLFCEEDGHFFPKINNIPVLLRKNAILVSHYSDFGVKK